MGWPRALWEWVNWKLVVHMAIAILATIKVISVAGNYNDYVRSITQMLQHFFVDKSGASLFVVSEMNSTLLDIIHTLDSLPQISVDRLAVSPNATVTINFLSGFSVSDQVTAKNPLAFFWRFPQPSTLLDNLKSIQIFFSVTSHNMLVSPPVCIVWSACVTLSYGLNGYLARQLTTSLAKCPHQDYHVDSSFYIDINILIFTFLSTLLGLRSLHQHLRSVAVSPFPSDNAQSHILRRLGLFSGFFFTSILSNICNASVAAVFLVDPHVALSGNRRHAELFAGLGAFLAWTNLIRYFRYRPKFYILTMTLASAKYDVLSLLVSVIAVFVGFSCLAVILFGHVTPQYKSIEEAMSTNMALMLGDSVYYILTIAQEWSGTLGAVVIFTWVLLSITVLFRTTTALFVMRYVKVKQMLGADTDHAANMRTARENDELAQTSEEGDDVFVDPIKRALEQVGRDIELQNKKFLMKCLDIARANKRE